MVTLKPTVDVIWRTLDMPPPLGEIGRSFDFDLSGSPVSLNIEPNGETVSVRGTLGYLDGDAFAAQDQIRHLLRLGLGLMAVNQGALEIPNLQEFVDDQRGERIPVYAVSKGSLNNPDMTVSALRDIVEWHGYAENVLQQVAESDRSENSSSVDEQNLAEGQFVIFQP